MYAKASEEGFTRVQICVPLAWGEGIASHWGDHHVKKCRTSIADTNGKAAYIVRLRRSGGKMTDIVADC